MLFYLMHENDKVMEIDINVACNMFFGCKINKVFNADKLPIGIRDNYTQENKIEEIFYDWWNTRFFNTDRYHFQWIANNLALEVAERNNKIQYSDSLYTYCASLLDHYWLNPVEESTIDRGFTMGNVVFNITPTTWEKVNFENKEFNNEIGKLIENSVTNYEDVKDKIYTEINLDSPNLTLPGNVSKLWIRAGDNIVCKKIYQCNESGIMKINKLKKINEYLESKRSPFLLRYMFNENVPNVCYSIRFLNQNEELVTSSAILMMLPEEKRNMKNFCNVVTDLGCDKKLLKQYINNIEGITKMLNKSEVDINDVGFIVDSSTGTIIRPAPIYGTSW